MTKMTRAEILAVAAYVAPRARSNEEGRKIKVVDKDGKVTKEISLREMRVAINERAGIELTIILEPDMCINFAKKPDGSKGCGKRLSARALKKTEDANKPECYACRRRRRTAEIEARMSCSLCGEKVSIGTYYKDRERAMCRPCKDGSKKKKSATRYRCCACNKKISMGTFFKNKTGHRCRSCSHKERMAKLSTEERKVVMSQAIAASSVRPKEIIQASLAKAWATRRARKLQTLAEVADLLLLADDTKEEGDST